MHRTPVHVRNPDLTPVAILPGKPAHGVRSWGGFLGMCTCTCKPCGGSIPSRARLQTVRQATSAESFRDAGQCCQMRSAAHTIMCRPPLTASPLRIMSAWPGLTLPSACAWQARPPHMARSSERPACALPLSAGQQACTAAG